MLSNTMMQTQLIANELYGIMCAIRATFLDDADRELQGCLDAAWNATQRLDAAINKLASE